ncbi:phosphatidic acid phosphatase [Achlya hypogyna]|uniref:Phosphatidic acid phosphatase n=1 Tax=Achlya hypogyna TaxID=1202772 RepID=A0A1V9Z2S9_ACHHY|nr:phosphatidic acid phosphatase [Achlya hypogyna]
MYQTISGGSRSLHGQRAGEFVITIVIVVAGVLIAHMPHFDRSLPSLAIPLSPTSTVHVRDPSFDLPKSPQQFSMPLTLALAYGIPLAVHGLFQWHTRVPYDTRDFVLSLVLASALTQTTTNAIKVLAGRFRPCFFAMCDWDASVPWDGHANLCRDKAGEAEGRKSFPSGHTSTAFSTLFFLTIYLMGRLQVFATPHSVRSTLNLFAVFAPCVLATWIAVSRTMDNMHHYSDIVAGAVIGITAGALAYSFNYASIFTAKSSGLPREAYEENQRHVKSSAPSSEVYT